MRSFSFLALITLAPLCLVQGATLSTFYLIDADTIQGLCRQGGNACNGSAFIANPSSPTQVRQVEYQTSATADYGVLRTYSKTSVKDAPANVAADRFYRVISSVSFARFTDTFTLIPDNVLLLGEQGLITFSFDITGTFSTNTVLQPYTAMTAYKTNDLASNAASPTSTGPGKLQFSLNVIFGQPTEIEISLYGASQINTNMANGSFGEIDLRNTAILTRILASNSAGDPIAASFTTQSGSPNYQNVSTSETTVPEPATLSMLSFGLMLGLLRHRSKM